jgi:hypothetical protein
MRVAPLHCLTLLYCIVLANIPIDFVVGRLSFFERTGEWGQSLYGVPAGATPSLKPETWRAVGHTSRDRRFVVHDFATGEISPVNQSRTARFFLGPWLASEGDAAISR